MGCLEDFEALFASPRVDLEAPELLLRLRCLVSALRFWKGNCWRGSFSLFAGRTDRLDCQRHIALVEQAERERVPCTHVRVIVRPCALLGSLPFLPDWLCSLPQWLRNYLEVSCLHLPISVLCPFTSAKFMVQKCRMLQCFKGWPCTCRLQRRRNRWLLRKTRFQQVLVVNFISWQHKHHIWGREDLKEKE